MIRSKAAFFVVLLLLGISSPPLMAEADSPAISAERLVTVAANLKIAAALAAGASATSVKEESKHFQSLSTNDLRGEILRLADKVIELASAAPHAFIPDVYAYTKDARLAMIDNRKEPFQEHLQYVLDHPDKALTAIKEAATDIKKASVGSLQPVTDTTAMQSMVIVEGDEGRGSAFVVRMDGKTYLVTNSHVVRGNKNVKFTNLRNEQLVTGPLQIADKVDAVRTEITESPQALELAPHIEQTVKIGDPILVAGNSEGEGVVREIPGKVVGIGPDRIEVDAEFVPGNSGSPILLKSTGKVIGVATYMTIPRSVRGGTKSPLSLNEVRRFGFRLDTVAQWIVPQPPDRVMKEGLKLAEVDEMTSAIIAVLDSNAAYVGKLGSSTFVTKEQARNPHFAALAKALDTFAGSQKGSPSEILDQRSGRTLFQSLKLAAADDIRGYTEESFSGYYAVQFKERRQQRKELYEWFTGSEMETYCDIWLGSAQVAAAGAKGAAASKKQQSLDNFLQVLTAHKWSWHNVQAGGPDRECTFRADGTFHLRRFATTFQITKANQVEIRRKGAKIVITFDRDCTSFETVDWDNNRITGSRL